MSTSLSTLYYGASVVADGDKARKPGPGQDAAAVRHGDDAIVIAVADGVSLVNRQISQAQVGAWLVAELAASAAARAAATMGADAAAVASAVSASLADGLAGLGRQLERDVWSRALTTTLVLAVVAREWTSIWLSGDGCWGFVADPAAEWTAPDGPLPTLRRADDGLVAARQSIHLDHLADLASREAAMGRAPALREVLRVRGRVHAAWVATDGLRHEADTAAALDDLDALRGRARLEATVHRPERCDDLAVAWAVERFPGLLAADREVA